MTQNKLSCISNNLKKKEKIISTAVFLDWPRMCSHASPTSAVESWDCSTTQLCTVNSILKYIKTKLLAGT